MVVVNGEGAAEEESHHGEADSEPAPPLVRNGGLAPPKDEGDMETTPPVRRSAGGEKGVEEQRNSWFEDGQST